MYSPECESLIGGAKTWRLAIYSFSKSGMRRIRTQKYPIPWTCADESAATALAHISFKKEISASNQFIENRRKLFVAYVAFIVQINVLDTGATYCTSVTRAATLLKSRAVETIIITKWNVEADGREDINSSTCPLPSSEENADLKSFMSLFTQTLFPFEKYGPFVSRESLAEGHLSPFVHSSS